jgi:hypothetical protein
MFTVATLALASPVYLRLLESPGPARLLGLVVLVQLAPTLALWLVDLVLARRAPPPLRRVWRGALYLTAVLAVCRQAQVSLRLPGAPASIAEPVVMGLAFVVGAILVMASFRVLGTFLVAFALPLVAWTLYVLVTLDRGTPARTEGVTADAGPPVFVLLFDGLDPAALMRDGRVRADWPAFRRLADRSLAFTDATANYANTCPSVATMLGGRLPPLPPRQQPGCLEAMPGLRSSNLLSDLARARRVIVYGQPLRYCFDAAFECRGTADLQARRPWLPLLQHWFPNGIRAATGIDRFIGYSEHTYTLPLFDRFLADITATSARGTVFYLHLLLPHEPYVFGETGGAHLPVYPGPWRNEHEYAEVLGAYVRQARFVDHLLGRFLARLDAQGLTDESVIALTSDHGLAPFETFAAPRFAAGIEINSSRPRVVLMLHAPGLAPTTTAGHYQHVDFRRLLSETIRGDRASLAGASAVGERLFCSHGRWYVRRDDGTWRPRGDDRGAGVCEAPAS